MTAPREICIVGAGPRGLSVLERLCAGARHHPPSRPVVVHVVDPWLPGAGRVWRTGQSDHLLMNTVAAQITLYTDESVHIEGPIEPGPSLYEWARELGEDIGPDTYPTRAFYGRYLDACFQRVVERAPAGIEVRVHRSPAVAMADTHGVPNGPQGLRLEDGTRLNHLDAIVLAQGHVPSRLTGREARTASLARIHHLDYRTPANPADVDLSAVGPGEPVLLRGLGLNFFDYMALFSLGRGGGFSPSPSGLVYHPSGREPKMFAFSRRGVPYQARGENEKGATGRYEPRLLTAAAIAGLRESADRRLSFTGHLWPLIRREVESVYYAALLAQDGRPEEGAELATRYLALPPATDTRFASGAETALLEEAGIGPDRRWDWDRLTNPLRGRSFRDRDHFQAWLLDYLAEDVRQARLGNLHGPLKAALDALRDLRNEIRMAVDHGGLDGDSHRDDLQGWYTPLNAYLSIGPPVRRIEELAALVRAGVVTVTGPGTQVRIDPIGKSFVARSEIVPAEPIVSKVLIEARLPEPDLRRTDDPLLRHLLDTDQCRPYSIPGAAGGRYETGGLAVTDRPYHLLDGQDRSHPRRFAYGVPTEAVHWVTAAGIRPGVDSVTLGDSDAIAQAVLALPELAKAEEPVKPAEGVLV